MIRVAQDAVVEIFGTRPPQTPDEFRLANLEAALAAVVYAENEIAPEANTVQDRIDEAKELDLGEPG